MPFIDMHVRVFYDFLNYSEVTTLIERTPPYKLAIANLIRYAPGT